MQGEEPRNREASSPPLEYGLHIVTSFQRGKYGRGGKSSTVKKPDQHGLSQVIKDRCRCNNTAQEQVKFHRQMDFLNLENTKIYLRIKREKRRWERFMKTYLAVSSKWFN